MQQVNSPNEQISTSFKDGKMYETKTLNGKISTVTIFEDLNKDGKYDDNEITKVETYNYHTDNSYTKNTFLDTNHDGYDDEIWTQEYDNNGCPGNLIQKKEKNINNTMLDSEKINRNMQTHRNGLYIKG